ncbi:MAG TPA: hypothetical protein VF773_01240 [Verrucomicrobiae bacterium]
MDVRFANSYVEGVFAERDLLKIYHLISVISDERELPEECWLFNRLLEWMGSTRSGVWQYYEHLPAETYERIIRALERFGLETVAEQYRSGHSAWAGPDQAASVDAWIDAHEEELEDTVFRLIAGRKEVLLEAR